jgi:hypothetical protein
MRALVSALLLRITLLTLLTLLACVVSARPAPAQVCDITQGGDPTDGVTTVTVLVPEANCSDINLLGFRCMTLRSTANDSGSNYDVLIAWNLPGETVRGTFTWISGDGGLLMLRNQPAAKTVQNDLAATHDIRTIETDFLDADGYHVFPSNGPVNIAAVYMDLLEYLIAQGIMSGVHGHVGVSGGTQIVADAMAYHDASVLLDGLVIAGGPIFVDLEASCTETASPLYANANQRGKVDLYNYTDLGSEPCAANDPDPTPPYACRSTLAPAARKVFPDEAIHQVIGTDESDWIQATSAEYFATVEALAFTYEQPPAPHNVFGTTAGAEAAKARILSIVSRFESGAGAVPDGGAFVPGTPLTMGKSGSDVTLAWGAACRPATDYAVYEGELGVPSSLEFRLCSTGGTTAQLSPSAGNRYYLVVPRNGANEGSYGKSSDGTELGPAAEACGPQLVAGCN